VKNSGKTSFKGLVNQLTENSTRRGKVSTRRDGPPPLQNLSRHPLSKFLLQLSHSQTSRNIQRSQQIPPPVVPVWIALEGLPAHLQDKRAIYSIANLIGKPLKVDSSTLSLNRPSVARIFVELDVSIANQITNGSYGSFS